MPGLESWNPSEQEETKTVPNPTRGCGHLKREKAYIRGIRGSGSGMLPAWVQIDPPIPYKLVGTDGSMTRSYKRIAGPEIQLVTETAAAVDGESARAQYIPHSDVWGEYADAETSAFARMVEAGLYDSVGEVPEREIDRHLDRIRERGDNGMDVGPDWERIAETGHSDLLMRAGKTDYPNPDEFAREAANHGLSKAIPVSPNNPPPHIVRGVTRCWVVHPNARGDGEHGVIGYAYIGEIIYTQPEDGKTPQWVEDYQETDQIEVVDIEEPADHDDEDEDQVGIADF